MSTVLAPNSANTFMDRFESIMLFIISYVKGLSLRSMVRNHFMIFLIT